MREPENIDEYGLFLTQKLKPWSPRQRVALAAAIAERWLPAYESFSAEKKWGDADSLRHGLEAVWGHVQGRPLADATRHIEQIEDLTPHQDKFDAPEALAACAILTDALYACDSNENTIPHVKRAVLGVIEGIAKAAPGDTASQQREWQKGAVRKELEAQLGLIEKIDAVTTFNVNSVRALRSRLGDAKVKSGPLPKPKAPPR